eukprot:gnl/Chilomastix_cuspidata/2714.p1 GENE.gnl/Chilomastix_cuspidata/2714~~gnl/Chilomastix_cuspidata/2714.p1  ORF type:complete len:1289 (+),score=426.76 gnl/Chilomastix_cuspidata/2714:256-3867(+)
MLFPFILKQLEDKKLSEPSVYRLLQVLTDIRGERETVRYYPHGVHLLEPLVLLCRDLPSSHEDVAAPILVHWLSLLLLEPFDFSVVDSGVQPEGTLQDTVASLLLSMFISHGPVRATAVRTAASFASRPDSAVEGGARDKLVDAAIKSVRVYGRAALPPPYFRYNDREIRGQRVEPESASRYMISSLAFLSTLLKLMTREESMVLIDRLPLSMLTPALKSDSAAVRIEGVRLASRIALVFARTRDCAWAYKQTVRSLEENLKAPAALPAKPCQGAARAPEVGHGIAPARGLAPRLAEMYETALVENDLQGFYPPPPDPSSDLAGFDVPLDFDECIDVLLTALMDASTKVRTRAARALGDVIARLPIAFAEEVLDAVASLISPAEEELAWHGGLLALAEATRRGLIPLRRLPSVVGNAIHGLTFYRRRGGRDSGTQVRDAAAYVSWSLARIYSGRPLEPLAPRLASSLLTTSLFDQESTCRRAAAAAFQELVGRQGSSEAVTLGAESAHLPRTERGLIPGGIELVTVLEYNALGTKRSSFLSLAPRVAQICDGVYADALLAHVLSFPLVHWDEKMRAIAAETLMRITTVCPTKGADVALPYVTQGLRDVFMSRSSAMLTGNVRAFVTDGLVRGARLLLRALSGCGGAPALRAQRAARDFSEWLIPLLNIKGCWSTPALAAELATVAQTDEATAASLDFLLASLKIFSQHAQELEHLSKLCAHSFKALAPLLSRAQLDELFKVVVRLARERHSTTPTALRTVAAVAPSMSDEQCDAALDFARPFVASEVAEERREATLAVGKVLSSCSAPEKFQEYVEQRIVPALQDYSIDKRGDIGSWVRRASLKALWRFVRALLAHSQRATAAHFARFLLQGCVRAGADRQESVHEVVLLILPELSSSGLLPADLPAPAPHDFPSLLGYALGFLQATALTELAGREAALGVAASLGSGVASLRNQALQAMKGMSRASYVTLADLLLAQLRVYHAAKQRDESKRMIEPIANSLMLLLFTDFIRFTDVDIDFMKRFLQAARETMKTSSVRQLIAALRLFSAACITIFAPPLPDPALGERERVLHASQHPDLAPERADLGTRVLTTLMRFLGHQIPAIRQQASEELLQILFVIPFIERTLPEEPSTATELLLETDWGTLKTPNAREQRSRVAKLFGITMSTPQAAPGSKKLDKCAPSARTSDQYFGTYRDLVGGLE